MPFPTYAFSDTGNGQLNAAELHTEIASLSIASAVFQGINADNDAAQFTVLTDTEPNTADKTAIDSAVAAHVGIIRRSWEVLAREPEMEPVVPGASKVVANDRPAIEVDTDVTGYAALQAVWPLVQYDHAQIKVLVHFILKAAGTGSKVRIAARFKAQGPGEDSSVAFAVSGFVVVLVTHTTIGEVFKGELVLDASSAHFEDAVALQVGRDGNNTLGAGDNDDVDQAIQVIAVRMEAR